MVEERAGRLKLAQKLLRHSNLSTTADTYTHTSRESEREAAIALERAYFSDDLFPIFSQLGTGNSYWLLLAERHLNRRQFGATLGRIALLPLRTG